MSLATVQPVLPGIFRSLAPTLDHYGYLAVAGLLFLEDFGTPFIPGETILISAAVFAGAGRLNVVAVGLVAVLAAVLGDNVGYLIGRLAGRELVLRWGRYVLLTEERLSRAEGFFSRQGGKIVTVSRFIDGLRQVNGIVAGVTEMAWMKFLAFNVTGAVAWVGCWVAVGYTAGDHIDAIYRWFSRLALYALAACVVLVVAMVLRHRRRKGSRGVAGEALSPTGSPSQPEAGSPPPAGPSSAAAADSGGGGQPGIHH